MTRILLIGLLTELVIASSCRSYTCNNIPDTFPSYDSAIHCVEQSTFRFTDQVEIPDTTLSWIPSLVSYITSAKYYSCDRKVGYMVFKVSRGSKYMRTGIPIELWKRFRDTLAKGPYYESNIANKKYRGIIILREINSD